MNSVTNTTASKKRVKPVTLWPFGRSRGPNWEVQQSWLQAEALIGDLRREGNGGLTDEQCRILETRWVGQAQMYERLWRGQRDIYYLLRIPIIAGAATVPVLAGLAVPKLATALVGLLVAGLTGVDSFLRLGLRWQQHRHAATALGFEGWEFLELSGDYRGKRSHADAYPAFITTLETMNRGFALSYLDLFRTQNRGKDGSG